MEELQRTARFAWAPFVARLILEGRLARPPHPALPVDDPQALTSEVVADVREIVRRGVWAYLVRQGGWRRSRFVDPGRDRVAEGRLWEVLHLEPPTFSPGSVRLLLLLFNATRPAARPEDPSARQAASLLDPRWQLPEDLPLDPSKSGDVLLHHVVFQRLLEAGGPSTGDWVQRFADNPLNLLSHPHLFSIERSSVRERLARLLDDDLHPFLPWLAHDWVNGWARFEPTRVLTRHGLQVLSERQRRIWKSWTRLAIKAERYDLLVPFVAFWSRLDTAAALQDFERLAADCRLAERAELARPWVELLELGVRLHETADRVRALHPVDREAVHQLFLTACAEHDFEDATARIERLIQRLRPSLGYGG